MNPYLLLYLYLVPMLWLPYPNEQFERAKSAFLLVTTYALTFTLSPDWDDPLLWVGVAWLAASLLSSWGGIRPVTPHGVAAPRWVGVRVSLLGLPGSNDGVLQHLAFLILYLAASQEREVHLASAIAYSTLPVTFYGYLQLFGFDFMPWRKTIPLGGYERPFSGLGHPIQLGVWLSMALPFVLAQAHPLYGVPYAILILTLVWATLSRAAWAASLVSVSLYALLTGALGWLGAVGAGGLVAYAIARGLLLSRLKVFLEAGDRAGLARFSIDTWKRYPWLGVGPDRFVYAFATHNGRSYVYEQTWSVRAHWEALHILVTMGLVGGFVAAAGTGATLALALGAILVDPVQAAPWVAALAAFGVGVFANFHSISTLTLGVVALAALSVLVS